MKTYVNFWNNYFNFTGRTGRKEYWTIFLINFLLPIGFFILLVFLELLLGEELYQMIVPPIAIVIYGLFLLSSIIPSISCSIRRLRDADLPWGLIFVPLFPLIGISFFIFMCLPTKNHNRS